MGQQWCCGGPMWETGYVDVAHKMAEHNMLDWRKTGTKKVICLDPHDYLTIIEHYPPLDENFDEFEIILGVDLVAELIRDGKLELTTPIERTVTYHDPCRLNKRLGKWKSPREILRAIPGLTFVDVDHVTQWSYCSGAGANLAAEKPELTAEISRRRVARAGRPRRRRHSRLRLSMVGAASERAGQGAGNRGLRHLRARGRGGRVRGLSMAVAALPDTLIDELVAICGEENVFTGRSALFNRARVPSPFPAHRWEEFVPQAVVLPTSAEQVSEVVKLANRQRVPVVPRAGGTGLTDGAVPLRHGILVDVKLMNKILEIDVEDRTVTVQPGINMLKLSEELKPLGFIYPDNPASYPCSLVGRPDRDERLVADRRPLRSHARSRDLVRDRASDRRDHPGRRRRRPEGPEVVVRLSAQAPLHGPPGDARDRHRGDARARASAPRPSSRRSSPSRST